MTRSDVDIYTGEESHLPWLEWSLDKRLTKIILCGQETQVLNLKKQEFEIYSPRFLIGQAFLLEMAEIQKMLHTEVQEKYDKEKSPTEILPFDETKIRRL